MLYENPNKDPHSDDRFHIELHFSPGAKGNQQDEDFPQGGGFRPNSQPPSRAVSCTFFFLVYQQKHFSKYQP